MDEEIARLNTLLDHYRGTCDLCGREGVLLDFTLDFDTVSDEHSLDTRCWVDPQECQRVAYARWHEGLNLTPEMMRALTQAAADDAARRFGALLESGAFDGIALGTPEGAREMQRRMGWERPTHADIERWARDGWLEALAGE